jgi:4-hydroxybenzoate polyprenyltransferase
MSIPATGAVAELIRLPAVLTVPGDVLLGAAASGQRRSLHRTAGLVGASSCLYLAGMALNDYADRAIDAVERPGRPIPSGRVTPTFALSLAGALTVAGGLLAVGADGRHALKVFAPLAAAVWAYDLGLKSTSAGMPAMSACRGLDVAAGAGVDRAASALPAAVVVAAHTAVVTTVSRREVQGAGASLARGALAGTAGVTALTAGFVLRASRRRTGRAAALGLLAAYGVVVGRPQAEAVRDPSPARLQRVVGSGICGLILLEAALVAGIGSLAAGTGLAALWPLARWLGRKAAVT